MIRIIKHNDEMLNTSRPKGRKSKSHKDVLDSIALIATKYELDPGQLLDAFKEAWMNQESYYGILKIENREADQNIVNFLVTRNGEVVWQFPIGTNILEKSELFKPIIPIIQAPIIRKNSDEVKRIGELRAKMKGVSLTARVLEVPQKVLVRTRYGGESFVSNVLLADETGTILLSLWNNQIDDVIVGDTVKIENATISMFQGELQLRINRGGTIIVDRSKRTRYYSDLELNVK